MSKSEYIDGEFDRVLQSGARSPACRVWIWNPSRCNVQDVVLGRAESPAYDITPWVETVSLNENASFENAEDATATSCTIVLTRDADASPIPISERTLIDGAPIRIWQGDTQVDESHWVLVFTGRVRGYPSAGVHAREPDSTAKLTVLAVGREEQFLNTKITARSYEEGEDVGKIATETAIEFLGLDRREVLIGEQGYAVAQTQQQLVDIAVLNGIYQILFTVGKKPRFDSFGKLVAADSDLDKAPARIYTEDVVVAETRVQGGASINNSVRLLGLSNVLTEVVEQEKRLAHGEITSGFWETTVRQKINFSEPDTIETGARRARDTWLWDHIGTIGSAFGGDLDWHPEIESDGYTCFGGTLSFDTGFAPYLKTIELAGWVLGMGIELIGQNSYPLGTKWINIGKAVQVASMVALLLTLMEIGRVEWKIYGKPFNCVFQQICSTATLKGIGATEIKEREFRNDWLYDVDYMDGIAKDLLKRELVKSQAHEILLMDDPILECDDVIQVGTGTDARKYYVTTIQRQLTRLGTPAATMNVVGWRVA